MSVSKFGLTLLLAFSATSYAAPADVDASDFSCLSDLTPVNGFFVGNLNGDIDATVEVAKSKDGGVYPVGSVVQLVPTEVMVKHEKGVSPATNDWEFFELKVSKEGSEITTRGFTDVVNRFGGNCLDCHIKARPEWDLICGKDHGCLPIPLTPPMISGIQKTDPRCAPTPLTEEEIAALKMLAGGS